MRPNHLELGNLVAAAVAKRQSRIRDAVSELDACKPCADFPDMNAGLNAEAAPSSARAATMPATHSSASHSGSPSQGVRYQITRRTTPVSDGAAAVPASIAAEASSSGLVKRASSKAVASEGGKARVDDEPTEEGQQLLSPASNGWLEKMKQRESLGGTTRSEGSTTVSSIAREVAVEASTRRKSSAVVGPLSARALAVARAGVSSSLAHLMPSHRTSTRSRC
jgi:hypothetical protein